MKLKEFVRSFLGRAAIRCDERAHIWLELVLDAPSPADADLKVSVTAWSSRYEIAEFVIRRLAPEDLVTIELDGSDAEARRLGKWVAERVRARLLASAEVRYWSDASADEGRCPRVVRIDAPKPAIL